MKNKKTGLLTKILVVCVAVYAVFNLMSLQLDISEKQREIAELEDQIELTRNRNAARADELDSNANEESIKSAARDELGFVVPGERIFIDISN